MLYDSPARFTPSQLEFAGGRTSPLGTLPCLAAIDSSRPRDVDSAVSTTYGPESRASSSGGMRSGITLRHVVPLQTIRPGLPARSSCEEGHVHAPAARGRRPYLPGLSFITTLCGTG